VVNIINVPRDTTFYVAVSNAGTDPQGNTYVDYVAGHLITFTVTTENGVSGQFTRKSYTDEVGVVQIDEVRMHVLETNFGGAQTLALIGESVSMELGTLQSTGTNNSF